MEETILEVVPHHKLLKVQDVERLTVRDIQLKRSHVVTIQCTVLEVGLGFVSVHISSDFPGLDLIFDNTSSSGRYLRLYQTVDIDCQIVEEDNVQVSRKDME